MFLSATNSDAGVGRERAMEAYRDRPPYHVEHNLWCCVLTFHQARIPVTRVSAATLMVLTLAVSATSCGETQRPEPAATLDVESAKVLDVLHSYYDAFSERNWQRFESHFWPGASITTVWQPPGETAARVVITSIPDFVDQAPAGPGSREIFEERLLSAEVTAVGNLAQAWARYKARFGDPGAVQEWNGVDAFTLMEHDGEWRIVSLAFAPER